MKHLSAKVLRSAIAMLLACCMLVGAVPVFAAEVTDVNDDGVIKMVSLGASNANGYALDGYLTQELIDMVENSAATDADPSKVLGTIKDTANVYGYKRAPEEAYPAKLKASLEERGYNVDLTQLAISSMRAEELRVLLDNEYYGDAYTRWRFIKDNGKGWFDNAEPGGVDVLRVQYQEAIADADLVTLDIGVNNFGVYSINRITSGGKFADADFTNVFDAETLAKMAQAEAEIRAWVSENTDVDAAIAKNSALAEQLDLVVETFAYALTGFCVSFDASVAKIYELNPDVQIVVVSIQNLMHGLDTTFEGVDALIPLGDIYGAVVNMANIYTAVGSPYANTYNYAYAGENGHATTFLDEIRNYNGNPRELSGNVIDSFNLYDNNMFTKYALWIGLRGLQDPASGMTYEQILAQYGLNIRTFVQMGEAGLLPDEFAPLYAMYEDVLYTVYDALAQIMQAGAEVTTIDVMSAVGPEYDYAQDAVGEYLVRVAQQYVTMNKMTNPDYRFDFATDRVPLSNGTVLCGNDILADPVMKTVLGMGVRFDVGNSFYAHPSADGHTEIRDAILKALDEDIMGYEVAIEEALKLLNQAYDYAEKNGYIDMLEAEIAELKARLETEADAVKAELEAAIAELEAELAALKAEIEAQIAAQIAALKAEIEALKAELKAAVEEAKPEAKAAIEAKIAELEAKVEALKAEVEAKVAAVKAEIEAKIAAAKAAAEAKIAQIKAEIEAEIAALEAEIAAAYENATTGEYTVGADSYYVSIGDSDAHGVVEMTDNYGEKLAAELGLDVETQYAELTDVLLVSELREALDSETYVSEIEKADLITVSMNKDNYTVFALDQVSAVLAGRKPAEMDWAQYLTEDGAALMDKAIAKFEAYLAEQGVDAALVPMVSLLLESYAYGYADFAFNYTEVLNKIHAINPEALVVVVGAYNPFDTLVVEDTAVGEYLDVVIALSDAHYLAYAMLTDNTVFVDVPDTTTVADDEYEVITLETYLTTILNPTQFHANEAGHEYIKNEILGALTVTVEEPPVVDPVFDKGDVNMDGTVNIQDAVQLYYYVNGKLELSDEALAIGDVAEPVGTVNIQDAVVLYYFVNGKIDTL